MNGYFRGAGYGALIATTLLAVAYAGYQPPQGGLPDVIGGNLSVAGDLSVVGGLSAASADLNGGALTGTMTVSQVE